MPCIPGGGRGGSGGGEGEERKIKQGEGECGGDELLQARLLHTREKIWPGVLAGTPPHGPLLTLSFPLLLLLPPPRCRLARPTPSDIAAGPGRSAGPLHAPAGKRFPGERRSSVEWGEPRRQHGVGRRGGGGDKPYGAEGREATRNERAGRAGEAVGSRVAAPALGAGAGGGGPRGASGGWGARRSVGQALLPSLSP